MAGKAMPGIRKPSRIDPAQVEAFVSGGEPPSEEASAGDADKPGRGLVKRKRDKDKPLLRRLTVYISPEIGRKLEFAAVERRVDMSTIVEEALAAHLK